MKNKFIFKENGKYNRQSYKNTLFTDLPEIDGQIDFCRSDFRGSKFYKLNISANFDRADFMGCSFQSVNFIDTSFGAPQFKNCIFENVIFRNNHYNATVFIKCSFLNCKFDEESIYSNFTECSFNKTEFKNLNFERSTVDNSKFLECNFSSVDFSTLAAEDLTFEATSFSSVSMSINYFFSYFIDSKTNLKDIVFEYRGSKTYLTEEVSDNYFNNLLEEQRYSELFNMCILLNNEANLYNILLTIISKKDTLGYQLLRCIECIIFYLKKGMLSFETASSLLNLLKISNQNIDINNLSINEKIYSLEQLLVTIPFDKIKLKDNNTQDFIMKFRCAIDSENEAEEYIENLLHSILLSTQTTMDFSYKLIKKEKGSWIFTFMISSAFLVYTLKQIQQMVVNTQIIYKNQLQIRFTESVVNDYIQRLEHNRSIGLNSSELVPLNHDLESLTQLIRNTDLTPIETNEDMLDKITNIDIYKLNT